MGHTKHTTQFIVDQYTCPARRLCRFETRRGGRGPCSPFSSKPLGQCKQEKQPKSNVEPKCTKMGDMGNNPAPPRRADAVLKESAPTGETGQREPQQQWFSF